MNDVLKIRKMLSLRDSGKFDNTNNSIVQLAARCGFNVPFYLSDFIRNDCPLEVKRLKMCVVLFMWSPPGTPLPVVVRQPKSWYENYFLNWESVDGVARFWYKESFGKLKFEGTVIDWPLIQYPSPQKDIFETDARGNFTKIDRKTIVKIAKQIASDALGPTEFDMYDGFIGVIEIDTQYTVDGGNEGNDSAFKVGDPHDSTCHEVGHIIGNKADFNFNHSFGIETTTYPGGEYGHPYCIMSARSYAGKSGIEFSHPAATLAEERTRGPGLNGGTRAFLHWAKSINYHLDIGTEQEFDLQSLGSSQSNTQVLLISRGVRTFFVEYRSAKDENDQGIKNLEIDAVVIVGIVTGGIATTKALLGGTFLGQIPFNFGSLVPETIINFTPYWGVKVISVNPDGSSVKIRIVKNFAFSTRIYRRIHDITFSEGSSSFQIESTTDAAKLLLKVNINSYDNLRKWQINGQPLRSLRSIVNVYDS